MPVDISMNSPLAEALQRQIQTKLGELGWSPADGSDTAMAEYLLLMVVNGKTEDEVASELASDLLNLSDEDTSAKDFSKWLFQTVELLNTQLSGPPQPQGPAVPADGDQDLDMDLSGGEAPSDISAPTGPKAMRNGAGNFRGGRDKRVMGQINRAMDRSSDAVLHRIRGQGGASDRINTHARGGPNGRGMGGFGAGRQQRTMNGRNAASFNHALAAAGMGGVGVQSGMPWMGPQGQPPMQPGPMDVYAMLEQQSRMMMQMQEQMQQQSHMIQSNRRGGMNNQRGGRPQGDRNQRPHPHQNAKSFRNGHQDIVLGDLAGDPALQEIANGSGHGNGEEVDIDMASSTGGESRRETSNNPAETMCKFNLNCTNKDCKFAHQSPAAPPGVIVDVHEVCTFGAACKNKKCTGRHPSPAARAAHQSELDCKFYPNCTNPHCPFRHPNMPLCRNGADCSVRGCKFTHIQTMCKFHPCTNRYCTFKHEDGQRGTFTDKVWTADGSNGSTKEQQPHISERKFVDESAPEETILPGADKDMTSEEAVIS